MSISLLRFTLLALALAALGCQHTAVDFDFAESVERTGDGAAIVRVGVSKPLRLMQGVYGGMETYSTPCHNGHIESNDPTVAEVAFRVTGPFAAGSWAVTGLRPGRTTLIATCDDLGQSIEEVEVRSLSTCSNATATPTCVEAWEGPKR